MTIAIVNDRIDGTRMTIYDVYVYLAANWTVDQIRPVLPLSEEQLQTALRYIDEHKAEVMEGHRQIEERIARGNPPHIVAIQKEAHAHLMALKEEMQKRKTQGVKSAGPSS